MNKTEIKELVDKVYAISWSGFPLDAFLNDIRDNNDPKYNKNRAYEDMKLIVDEIYRLREKQEEPTYTLEKVKKEWEENGFEVGITNRFIYIDGQESNNFFIFDRLELRCHSHNGWMNIKLFDLITKTLKALEVENETI